MRRTRGEKGSGGGLWVVGVGRTESRAAAAASFGPEKTADLRPPLPPPHPPLPGVQNMFCIESTVIKQHFKMTSSNQTLQARPPV